MADGFPRPFLIPIERKYLVVKIIRRDIMCVLSLMPQNNYNL
jgi:hypothetical protein